MVVALIGRMTIHPKKRSTSANLDCSCAPVQRTFLKSGSIGAVGFEAGQEKCALTVLKSSEKPTKTHHLRVRLLPLQLK
jgi:hypothetical protein